MQNAIIIGAGISGMATAIRLAARGFNVDVFEQSDKPGGKIAQFTKEGFRFDMGPSLFTMPEYVEELFQIAGVEVSDNFSYNKLEVVTKYFYEDGTEIIAYSDPEKFAEEIALKTEEDAVRVKKYLDKSKELYTITAQVFIRSSLHHLPNFFSRPFLKAYSKVYKLNAFRSMHSENSRWFSDERVIDLFDRFATYNGSNPYLAPATLNVIPHLEHNIGAFFPEKGMYGIIDSLYNLARQLGVDFHFNEPVERLEAEAKKVKSITTAKGNKHSGIVVSSIDVHAFYKDIYPEPAKLKKIEKQQRSTSALIFYWGIDKEFPMLDMHNILFSSNYREEFEHLFSKKTIYHDPTVYIFISSKQMSEDAPEGKENWFVMINVPENNGHDWDELKQEARKHIISKINRMLNTDIEDLVLFEESLDPEGIESRTSSYKGSLYGSSSNSRFSAFRRHPNFSSDIEGLYFTGGSVHPGGGIPLCLSSAAIVDESILKKSR